MANDTHVEMLRRSVTEWNSWRKSAKNTPDLSSADLSDLDLRGVHLRDAELGHAKLCGSVLSTRPPEPEHDGKWLDGTELRQGEFWADAIEIAMGKADLRGVNISYTDFNAKESATHPLLEILKMSCKSLSRRQLNRFIHGY